MLLTFQNIYNLAPDKDAFSRAKKQAHTRKWKDLQSNGALTWGESKSSGASYYKTIFDNTHPEKAVFHCSCPSRKRPCKHSIALALLLLEQSGAFRITEGTSDWVKELIVKKSAPLLLSKKPQKLTANALNIVSKLAKNVCNKWLLVCKN